MKNTTLGIIWLAILAMAISFSSCKKDRGELKRIWYNGSYNRDFQDLNDLHLAEAQRIGIQPASTREEAEALKKKMTEIKTDEYIDLKDLKHSFP